MRVLPVLWVLLVVGAMLGSLAAMATTEHTEASMLTRFTSDLELRTFVQEHGGGSNKNMAASGSAEDASYSGTNVQVEGVDESDRVKTDGTHIYIADGGFVHVVGAVLPMANVSEITVGASGSTWVQGLYLDGQRLVVLYSEYSLPGGEGLAAMGYRYYDVQRTCANVYDITDTAAPVLERSASMTGYLVSSRMIDGTLYMVTDQSTWSYVHDVQMPELAVGGESKGVAASEVYYDPTMSEVSSFVNLLAFDTSSGGVGTLTTLAGSASVVYMSPTALYVTMPLWSGSASSTLTTSIYRIAVDGTEMAVECQASVNGALLNQFAMDESDGRLRVATTTSWPDPSSEVRVFDLELNEVGALTGIARGESIYSCRYMGDRLYLVTYLQVDPLFVIDLTADTPSVLGELKVPGASNYLQMVGAGLMGIGFDNGSVKVSLFDVTEPGDVREIDSFVVEGFSYSPAQYDHKAVMYVPGTGTLVIPITYYGPGYWTDQYYRPSSAALVLQIGAGGVSEVGRIAHENATVDRSLYIGEVLYTISDTTVKASSLSTLELLDSITYGDGQGHYGIDGPALPI
jgi:uncharacterized secreted protein with C-terminal beta-propeller domain